MYSRLTKPNVLSVMAVALVLFTLTGCKGSGSFEMGFGIRFGKGRGLEGYSYRSSGSSAPLPATAKYVGVAEINGKNRPIYFDPPTGNLWARDAAGYIHEVDMDDLPPSMIEEIERIKNG